jgi:hypothetical protein
VQYNFLTNESTPDNNYNDFSFFTVSGPGTAAAMLLADTQSSGFAASATGYSESTGYRSFSYTFPAAGQYTIGFGVSDSRDTSYDSALLLDEVTLGSGTTSNRPPTAVDDGRVTNEDTPLTIAVLDNDSDPDGDALTVTQVTQGMAGTVTVNANQTVTYSPNANYYGQDSFTYSIADGGGGQATATVTVTVNSVNDGPVAADDTADTVQNLPVTIYVLSNDSDVDGGTLEVVSVAASRNGSVVINADDSISYTPNNSYVGQDSFSYTVADGQGGQATANVTVTIAPSASGVLNGGFEDGLLHWEAIGAASSETSSLGEAPVSGLKQGLISTANSYGGNMSVTDIEMFLGLPTGAVAGLAAGTPTAGSALRQTITVSAGMELTFFYNFLTNEQTPDGNYNDRAFFSVAGPGLQAASLLADTYTTPFSNSASAYKETTGYRTFQYAFPQSGQYTIGFGVTDARDTSYDSALLVDQIMLQAAAPQAAAEFDPSDSASGAALPVPNPVGESGQPDPFSFNPWDATKLWNLKSDPTEKAGLWKLGAILKLATQAVDEESCTSWLSNTSTDWENLVDQAFAGW